MYGHIFVRFYVFHFYFFLSFFFGPKPVRRTIKEFESVEIKNLDIFSRFPHALTSSRNNSLTEKELLCLHCH